MKGEGDELEEGVYKMEKIVERRVKKVRLNIIMHLICISATMKNGYHSN